jgi:hypothetical protein
MKKVVFLIALLVSSLSIAVAETNETEALVATITGKVLDKETKEALAGATIIVNGQKMYSDLDGNFTIEKVAGEKCELTVSMISYEPQSVEVNVKNNTTLLSVNLKQH